MPTVDEVFASYAVGAAPTIEESSGGRFPPTPPPEGAAVVVERSFTFDDRNVGRIVRASQPAGGARAGDRWLEVEFHEGPFPVKAWEPLERDESSAERQRRTEAALERQKRSPMRYSSFAPPDPTEGGIRRVDAGKFSFAQKPEQTTSGDVEPLTADTRWKAYGEWVEAGKPSPPRPEPAPPTEAEIRRELEHHAALLLPRVREALRV